MTDNIPLALRVTKVLGNFCLATIILIWIWFTAVVVSALDETNETQSSELLRYPQ